MSGAIAPAVITYAQNTEAVNGVRQLQPRAAGASAVSGAGGGSGPPGRATE
jgi:hypothetical protein